MRLKVKGQWGALETEAIKVGRRICFLLYTILGSIKNAKYREIASYYVAYNLIYIHGYMSMLEFNSLGGHGLLTPKSI